MSEVPLYTFVKTNTSTRQSKMPIFDMINPARDMFGRYKHGERNLRKYSHCKRERDAF